MIIIRHLYKEGVHFDIQNDVNVHITKLLIKESLSHNNKNNAKMQKIQTNLRRKSAYRGRIRMTPCINITPYLLNTLTLSEQNSAPKYYTINKK